MTVEDEQVTSQAGAAVDRVPAFEHQQTADAAPLAATGEEHGDDHGQQRALHRFTGRVTAACGP